MKKALIYTLSLALSLSLAACSKPQPDQQEPNQPDPATTSTPADVSTPEPPPAPPTPEPLADVAPAPQELSQEELQSYFSKAYESSSTYVSSLSLSEAINWELDVLKLTTERENKLLPSDYIDQYNAWRPMPEQQQVQQQQVQQQVQQPVEKKDEAPKKDQTKPDQSKADTSQSTTQQPKPEQQPQQPKPSGGLDIYGGFATYKEYIDSKQAKFPDVAREELERLFPDESKNEINWDKYNQDINDGYFG